MHVLIVKTSSMGDVIHTLPALTDAAAAIPGIRFDWVVEEGFAEIPTWHPAVDRVIPVAIRRWRKSLIKTWKSGEWKQFKQNISHRMYDVIIDAQGLLKSALLLRYAKGSRYGLDKLSAREPIASRFYEFPQTVDWNLHAVERIRQLFAKSLGYSVPANPGQFLLKKEQFPSGIVEQKPYVIFLHGTTWETKHWPVDYWCQLAQQVNQYGLHVVLPWGSENERLRSEFIASSCDNVKVLPKLTLAEIAGVICEAKAAIAVDTGLGHLTAALETPAVSLYGPTNPEKVGAYGLGQKHLTLDDCPAGHFPVTDPEIFAPMTPEIVWQALESLVK